MILAVSNQKGHTPYGLNLGSDARWRVRRYDAKHEGTSQ
jgi:hypothetical protein